MTAGVLVYLSGPLTARDGRTVEQNVADATAVYWRLLRAGIPAFCPHLCGAFPTAFEIDYETWIAYDYAVLDRCTHVLMLPRWESSAGAELERVYADTHDVPIYFDEQKLMAAILGGEPSL